MFMAFVPLCQTQPTVPLVKFSFSFISRVALHLQVRGTGPGDVGLSYSVAYLKVNVQLIPTHSMVDGSLSYPNTPQIFLCDFPIRTLA